MVINKQYLNDFLEASRALGPSGFLFSQVMFLIEWVDTRKNLKYETTFHC